MSNNPKSCKGDKDSVSNILITGATGYVGSALVPYLCAQGHDVLTSHALNADYGPDPWHRSNDVIHLACNTLGDWQVNVLGTVQVASQVHCGHRLVFASSLTAAAPQDQYDCEKRAGEEAIRAYTDLDAVILRLGRVYGPPIKSNKRSVLNTLITQAIMGEMLHLYGGVYSYRDYVFLDDVVRAFEMALTAPPGTYDVGCGRTVSLIEAAKKIAHTTGVQWCVDDNARDGPRVVADSTRWLPGWEPQVHLESGIAKTIEWAWEHRERDSA